VIGRLRRGLSSLLAGPSGVRMGDRPGYWRWLWRHKQWWFMRRLPEEMQTVIFTGLPGSGKTSFGCDYVIRLMREGYRCYSNVYMRDPYTGAEARPVLTWIEVLEASVEALEDGVLAVIYLAEINLMCDARKWQGTPTWWIELMQQRRHMGLAIIADTQHIGQVEKRLRLLIGQVVQVEPSPLRRRWRRWPRFALRHVDMQLGDDPAYYMRPSRPRYRWLYSHGFHGHASWQLLAGQDFGDAGDELVLARVEELRRRALALNDVTRLPSYADTSTLGDDPAALGALT